MNSNRVFILLYLLIGVASVAAVGWVLGSRIQSPAEAAARTAPPPLAPILVPIEERVLASEVVTRGTARFGLPQPISLPASALKGNTAGLITTIPVVNTQINEGDLLFIASGRPVLVMQGHVPAFRDLVLGVTGKDVLQLEQGLERLGFTPGQVDGTYDVDTSAAVAQWYESLGYEPFWPTAEQLANFRSLEIAAEDAKKAKMAAMAAAASAKLAVDAARNRAQHADKQAEADIQTGIAERAVVVLDPRGLATARAAADAKIEVGRAALRAARAEGEMNFQAALEAQKIAEFEANLASVRADRTATDVDKARRKLGAQVPVDEIVFIPSPPVRVEEIMGVVGSPISGPVLSVTDNKIVIDTALPLDAAPLVKPGMAVMIDEQSIGIKAKGVVEAVAKTPGTHGVDGYHIYCAIRVEEMSSPMQGFSLRLKIPIESSKEPVLSVPVSALSLAADGTSRIQAQIEGALEYVVVEPGMAANGFVEIKPAAAKLQPGQLVVVGSASDDGAAK
jgi:hypothetical protein